MPRGFFLKSLSSVLFAPVPLAFFLPSPPQNPSPFQAKSRNPASGSFFLRGEPPPSPPSLRLRPSNPGSVFNPEIVCCAVFEFFFFGRGVWMVPSPVTTCSNVTSATFRGRSRTTRLGSSAAVVQVPSLSAPEDLRPYSVFHPKTAYP